ncbi:MAG: OmpA family protein [Myxococcales bacterium]|nr:OmpA family protein [Myxococcales bacterium]
MKYEHRKILLLGLGLGLGLASTACDPAPEGGSDVGFRSLRGVGTGTGLTLNTNQWVGSSARDVYEFAISGAWYGNSFGYDNKFVSITLPQSPYGPISTLVGPPTPPGQPRAVLAPGDDFTVDVLGPNPGDPVYHLDGPDLVGLRLGFYPSRFFGVDGEAGVMPTRTSDDLAATLWGMRLGLVGQLGLWSVTPFVTVGGGMLNVGSDRAAVGSDIDAALYVGGGAKFYLTRYTMLRLDIRDHVTAGRGVDNGVVHNAEAVLGFSVTLGRKRAPVVVPIPDTDGDGFLDPDDECVDVPGVAEYNGCPIPDTDGDGILDPDDECVDVPGPEEFGGCPDGDGDGIRDLDDECPQEPGVAEYAGCPIPDSDGDGFLDPDDRCPLQPENLNGYKDGDGCCDVIPQEIKRFTGVIRGIYFDTNKSVVKRKSEKVLSEALRVFRDYPDFNVEIVGHTDSRGSREHNLDLSEQRAEAVRQWLVDHEIEPTRIITRGAGPDEPLEPNNTKRGRAKNRRIEFKLQNIPPGATSEPADICERPPLAAPIRTPVSGTATTPAPKPSTPAVAPK